MAEYGWQKLVPPKEAIDMRTSDMPHDCDACVQDLRVTKQHEATLSQQITNLEFIQAETSKTAEAALKKEQELLEVLEAKEDELVSLRLELESAKKKAHEIHSSSTAIFLKYEKQIEVLTSERNSNNLRELLYPVFVQAIISHKTGLVGEPKRRRTIAGMLRWLQQRANVVDYLRNKGGEHAKMADRLAACLFIDENQLYELVDACSV